MLTPYILTLGPLQLYLESCLKYNLLHKDLSFNPTTSYYLDSEHRLTVSSHVAKVVDPRVIILLKNDSFLAGFLSSPPKAENVARPMETSGGPKPGKRESGSGSSPDGTDSEDFVMVPAHLTMDAAEIRKHHNRGVVP